MNNIVNQECMFFHLPCTRRVKVELFAPLCDVSRAAGDRTDGDRHHSSHQDMQPISPTLAVCCSSETPHLICHVHVNL